MQTIFSLVHSLASIKWGCINIPYVMFILVCNMETKDGVLMNNGMQDSEVAHYSEQLTNPQAQKESHLNSRGENPDSELVL